MLLVHTKSYTLKFRDEEALKRFCHTRQEAATPSERAGQWQWALIQRLAWRDMAEPPTGPRGPAPEDRMVPPDLWLELRDACLWFWEGEEGGFPYQGYVWAASCEEVEEIIGQLGYWLVDCRKEAV